MKLLIFSFLVTLSLKSIGSICATDVEFYNGKNIGLEIEGCLKYDEIEMSKCGFTRSVSIEPRSKASLLLTYMCGYSLDPSLEEYWILYRVKCSGEYKKIKYSNKLIVIDE